MWTNMSPLEAQELADEIWEDESPAAARTPGDTGNDMRPLPPPIGLEPGGRRRESDSLGGTYVASDRYWGAQTQRSLEHFAIGSDHMPIELIHAYALVKEAAALANAELGELEFELADAIVTACHEIARGELDDHFPLSVYQTGSGTHTNANVNEVIANRAGQLLGAEVGSHWPIHPNNHVNMSQSTNDTFVTAMHVAAVAALHDRLLPALSQLRDDLDAKAQSWMDVPKPGRTHLMDATPLTVGQEWSGYVAALEASRRHVIASLHDLYEVSLGGTAVGTGANAPDGYTETAVSHLAMLTGYPYRQAANAFAAQATVDAVVRSHASLKAVAVTLFKIANDIRWMASGPRYGLGELVLPELEPGSSIMPGKVNPSQAEAMMMACLQVMGNDVTVAQAGAEGNFELNAFRPLVASNYLQSTRLLADASHSFATHLIRLLALDDHLVQGPTLHQDVGFVTALAKQVGYDRAAQIARGARAHGVDVLVEAAQAGIDRSVVDEALRMSGSFRAKAS